MRTYIIPCRLEYRTNVEVEADSEAEAMEKFNAGKWEREDSMPDLCNWESTGPAKLDE